MAENGLEQSKIGVKIAEAVGYGWLAIGKLETAFDPLSGELGDECASMIQNNGRPYQVQTANSDGSRCGQAINSAAYAGVSNPIYGTLTFGRQQSLELDSIGAYDPMGLSPAFALMGYSGGPAAGFGSTETARWDNSVKYVFVYGPAHAAAMYTNGGDGTAIFNEAYGFNAGAIWKGFSIDAVYTETKGAVSSSTIPYTSYASSTSTRCSYLLGNCPNALIGTISDNEGWSVMGKYTYQFEGGLKDEEPSAKLTVFAGYVHTMMGNPEDTNIPVGSTTIGGYELISATAGASTLTTNYYGTDKILQTVWTGARYELPSGWSFTGAYYNYTQNEFINSKGKSCATAAKATVPGANTTPSNCAGYLNETSFMVDYAFNKHFDAYAGVSYMNNGGGLDSGYLTDNMATVVTGVRLKF